MMSKSPFGQHRVIQPKGAFPQTAEKVNNDPEIYANEILVDVEILNITSASFARLKMEFGTDEDALANEIIQIIEAKGKYQDPILGSGGMLVGTVTRIGEALAGNINLKVGDPIATLVSLTATPLKVDKVSRINTQTGQVWVDGHAVLFEKGLYTKLPADLPIEVILAIMDVAGAPAMMAKTIHEGDTVLIMGCGKAGLLCLHEAKKRAGVTGLTIAAEYSAKRCKEIKALALADQVVKVDVTRPIEVMTTIGRITGNQMADFTVNVVNVADSEMACILSTRDNGTIFFYNTSTSFTKAALGAEAVGKPVTMLMGNGYVPGHADVTFQIMRENSNLLKFFMKYYAR